MAPSGKKCIFFFFFFIITLPSPPQPSLALLSDRLSREPIGPIQVRSDMEADADQRGWMYCWLLFRAVGFVAFTGKHEGERRGWEQAGAGCVAVVPAARGQNTVGSCVHLPANYTHHCVSSLLQRWGHKTIWQLPSTRQLRQANKQSQSGAVQMQSNYVYLYLLPTRAAAGQCPWLTRGRMIASFSYCAQFNHHKLGLACWGEAKLKLQMY